MIDATKITNYNLSVPELEEHVLYRVCAAGKNGVTAARCLNGLLTRLREISPGGKVNPFDLIKEHAYKHMCYHLKEAGIGCYSAKAGTFVELAHSGLDLKTCSVDELEDIKGIGPKTARCFLMHSRPDQRLAGLDVHILRFLRDRGYNVPRVTPSGKKYKEIESWFIKEADKAGKNVAVFDLEIWNEYRQKTATDVEMVMVL